MPLSLLTAPLDSIVFGEPMEVSTAEYVELAVYPPMTNTFDLKCRPQRVEIVSLQVGQTQFDKQLFSVMMMF